MRALLLILLVFSSSVFAEDEPSYFDFLKKLGKSDCEAYLDNGDALINASNKAANSDDWDGAFFYDDQAFHAYLKAFGHCEEPDLVEKTNERLNGSQLHSNQLACFYHLDQASSADRKGILAYNNLGSASTALEYQQRTLDILTQDAIKFCGFDDELSTKVDEFIVDVEQKIGKLQAHVDEHGDDSIKVP